MFKLTALAYALSLVSVQAHPVPNLVMTEGNIDHSKRGTHLAMGRIFPFSEFVGSGFRHVKVYPDLAFGAGCGFNVPSMHVCGAIADQPCIPAPLQDCPKPTIDCPEPTVECPPEPTVECFESAPECPPEPTINCPEPTPECSLEPTVEWQPESTPECPEPAPECTPEPTPEWQPAPTVECPEPAPESPPEPTVECPPASGAVPCDEAQGQACVEDGPVSFNFDHSQKGKLGEASVKDTTLYFNQKEANAASKSDKSNSQLDYSKN
ncbi:hypothetical protein IWW39_000769 [Coemansia spiralis]|uniref:Uncharacterized protein n=1 Tax=Coemansia spiralis TaxID=417178 RepID=A0A9W8GNM9_9FUNG|nr:hypothetical protein IWW39_000769 [Coemansia spiralis]